MMASTWPDGNNSSATKWYKIASISRSLITYVGHFGVQEHGKTVPNYFSEVPTSAWLGFPPKMGVS